MAFKPLDDAPAGPVSFRPIDDTETEATPTAADYLKGAASGVGGLASGVGYLAEAAGANQVGRAIRGIGDTTQKYWQDSMTPAGQRAAQSQVFEDDPNSVLPKLGDRWGQALAMGAAQSAPSMLAAAIPGGIAAAGLRGAAGMAASRGIGGALAPLAAGTAAPIGGWATNFAGNLAARVPTALGFGAAEGAVSGATNAAQWKSDIEQRPLDELRKMPGFAALESQIGEQAARQQIAEQGAADIMRNTTLSTGGIGALTGGGALGSAFQRVTTGAKGGLVGAIGRDAAKEAGQELLQSGGERAVQNVATRDYLDPNQSAMQGVVADALSGAAIGGVMGGVTGGGSYVAKGALQKAAEASAATVPPASTQNDGQGIPQGIPQSIPQEWGVPPAWIPPGTTPGAQGTQQPASGIAAAAAQNTPAAPGISPVPVSTAALSPSANLAESAGVPIFQPQEGAAARGNQTEVAKPAEPGQQAQPAKAADSAEAEREWRDFVASEGRDIGPRQLAVIRDQFMRRRLMNAGIEAATGRVEDARQREVAANRMAILEDLPLTTTGNTIRRFAAALRDAGIRDFRVSPEERQLIARRIAARDTLQPLEQVPPNELTLPEKQAKQAQPTMPRIESLRRRAAMPGVRIVGNRMLDRYGKRLATLSDDEAAELRPQQAVAPAAAPATDTELSDFIKSESADLGKRRVTLRALQAISRQKRAEDADKADIDALIEIERADLRGRIARLMEAQAAAKAKKPFVIPPLTTPEQQTTTRVMEQTPVQMPMPKTAARVASQSQAYSLPNKIPHDDWRGYERKDFIPTARQRLVMDAAKEAIDNGLSYNKEVDAFVAKKLNVEKETLESNRSGVDGGDFGYDVYFARKAVLAARKRADDSSAAEMFKVGQKLGRLKLQPPKLASAVVVESVDDGRVQVSFTYGSRRMSGMIDAAALKAIVDRQRQEDDNKAVAAKNKTAASSPVPQTVRNMIANHVGRLQSIHDSLTNVVAARGKGHILATEVADRQGDIEKAQAALRKIRELGAKNGADVESVINELGGEPRFDEFMTKASAPAAVQESQIVKKETPIKIPIPKLIGEAARQTEKSFQQIRDAISNVSSGIDGEKEYVEFDYSGDDGHNLSPGRYRFLVVGEAAKWLYRNGYMLGNDNDVDVGVAAKLLVRGGDSGRVGDIKVSARGKSSAAVLDSTTVPTQEQTAEQAIRQAAESVSGRVIGSWYPISATHNGKTQQFLSNIKRVYQDGKAGSSISLAQVFDGRMLAGEPLQKLFRGYRLSRDNKLTEEGVVRPASATEVDRWNAAFGKRADAEAAQAAKTYQGYTVEQMARVAERHGHDYKSALEKIAAYPSRWIATVQKWLDVEAAEKREERKRKLSQKWVPNDSQKKVIDLVSAQQRFSKNVDAPMFTHNAISTRALIARGVLSRIEYGDTVEYKLSPISSAKTNQDMVDEVRAKLNASGDGSETDQNKPQSAPGAAPAPKPADTKAAIPSDTGGDRKKAGALDMMRDGIQGVEVTASRVPNGTDAFQYALGKTTEDGATAVFRRRASERGTYGGWRWETDEGKLLAAADSVEAKQVATEEDSTQQAADQPSGFDAQFAAGNFRLPSPIVGNTSDKAAMASARAYNESRRAEYDAAAQRFLEGPLTAPVPPAKAKAVDLISTDNLSNVRPRPIARKVAAAKAFAAQFRAMLSVAGNKDIRYYLNGVHIEDSGRMVATDGHRVAVVDGLDVSQAPKKPEKQASAAYTVLGRDEQWIDGKFADYKRVMPEGHKTQPETVDATAIGDAARGIVRAARYTGLRSFEGGPMPLRIGDRTQEYNAQYIADAADLFRAFGYSSFEASLGNDVGRSTPLYLRSPDGKVQQVIMPMIGRDGEPIFAPFVSGQEVVTKAPEVKQEAKKAAAKPETAPAAAPTEPTSNAGELPAAEASTANTPAAQPLENLEELPESGFASRSLWSLKEESGTQGVWIGDLMKGNDPYPIRVTYKRTNRADWWIDLYDGGKLNDSFPFPWIKPSTTVQQVIDAFLNYVSEDKSADWSFANVGKKHNALLAKKEEIAKRKSAAEVAAIDKRIAEIGGTVGAPWSATDRELLAGLKIYEAKKYKTASDETMIRLLLASIAANPTKFSPGLGVGWRVSANQINRGFRVVSVDEVAKKAVIRQVADTGLTSTGGNNDRFEDREVYVSELLRDRKYDAATQPVETPAVEAAPPPIVEHVTAKGKTLRGTIRTDLTLDQARALDKYTFRKDGGYFIREAPTAGAAVSTESQESAPASKPENPKPDDVSFNIGVGTAASPADRAVYSMAAEGKPADEILSFISKASRRPFNRVLAAALRRAGLASTITLDSASRFGQQQGAARYAAAYNARTDTVALFTSRNAERHVLHELVHAATMKAIKDGGPAAIRIRALFRHVEKSGKASGWYGTSRKEDGSPNVDEFVAEVFTNPRFQEALKGIPAPAGSPLKTAWQWFVNIVARALGLKTKAQETALDRALTVGAQLMSENVALADGSSAGGDTRYAIAWHGTPHVWPPEPGFQHGRPRLDKMGSGEGAQAYGWGWYSAQAQDVAMTYQPRDERMEQAIMRRYSAAERAGDYPAAQVYEDFLLHKTPAEVEVSIAEAGYAPADLRKAKAAFRYARDQYLKQRSGALYQLDIPDDVMPKLLDWDKLLSEQPRHVQDALEKEGWIVYEPETMDADPMTGEDVIRGMFEAEGSKKKVSDRLLEIGIPGLRYLDGSSRSKGAGTYNYVIWDQKVLDRIALLERNGEKLDAIRAADEMRFSLDAGQPFDGPEVAATPLKPGTTTINVDGAERPALNSNGKPIHWSEEGVRNFWRWFSGSRVVDAQGRPLVVYHGTFSDFSRFSARKLGENTDDNASSKGYARTARVGFWFNSRPMGLSNDKYGAGYTVDMPIYLRLESPHREMNLDWLAQGLETETASSYRNQLIEDGYDSLVVPDEEFGGTSFVAFRPDQIKSATGNTGAFSPTDPDIRFNIATDWQQSPVAQEVAKAFSAAAKSDAALSWLNPVQTQYHKAERLAQQGKFGFKRVFELGQKFLSDISRFAILAENSAPTLFHQIRSLADAKQAVRSALSGDFGKQHNADIKAIAAPLYEGTLYGGGNPMAGIVWTDDQLRSRFGLTDRQITLYQEAREAVKVSMDEMAKSLISRHAKREKVVTDTSGSLQDVAEGVRDTLTLRADVLADDAQAEYEDAMQQVEDLRNAGGQERRANDMQKEAEAKLESQKAEVARIRATVADVQAIADKAQKLQDAGYFPLMRFGRHTVTARDADGKVQHFSMHDGIPLVPRSGQAQANQLKAALREEHPDWTVTTGLMNPEKYKLYQGMNVDALQLFADHLDDETKQTYQDIIRLATNERSALRRMLKREGTPGFDRDVRRTLASFILSNARYTSSAYHLADMAKAAEQAEKDGGDVGAEAVKLYDYVTKPQEEAAKLRGFLFFNFLGGSLAAAMVNATQVPMMTFPRLAQYEDAGKLASRLARAAKVAVQNPAEVTGDVGDALRRAEADGVTAPHQIYEMTATAAANVFSGSRAGSAILRGWGKPFALAEAFNRRTTFVAAYQIGQEMTVNQLRDAGASSAFEFAENIVNETQGIYNRGNRMNLGRGAILATVMTFKQYSVMYLEMFSRLPPKQKAIMAGMLILAAGAGGLPFAEDIEDIIDTIGQWLGYRTNTRRTIRRGLSDVIGQRAADIAMNGLLSQMGVDLHSRLGLQNILPGSAIMKPSTTDKWREFQDLLGPAASVVASMGQALQDLATGRLGKAALAMSPVAVQNAIRGGKMAFTGRAEDASGKPTIPVSLGEAGAKAVGFNPKSVSDYGVVKRASTQDDRLLDVTRERFTSAIVDAIVADDQEAKAEAFRQVLEWNRRNPDASITLNPAAIRKRVMDMRSDGPSRVLKSLSPSLRQQARQDFANAQ